MIFAKHGSVMDAFSNKGPSVTDTLVTALTNLSKSQEAMDNKLNEMSKKSKNETLLQRINLRSFRKIKHNIPRGAFFRKTVLKTQILPEVKTAEFLVATSAIIFEDSEDLDRIIHPFNDRTRTKVHIRHDNSHIKTFRSKVQISFFQPQSSSFQPQNQNFPNI